MYWRAMRLWQLFGIIIFQLYLKQMNISVRHETEMKKPRVGAGPFPWERKFVGHLLNPATSILLPVSGANFSTLGLRAKSGALAGTTRPI